MSDRGNNLEHVREELVTATRKFKSFASAHEGYAIIKEEVDELWDAIKANDQQQARHEAVQVAAMALRFLEEITSVEQTHNTRDGDPK